MDVSVFFFFSATPRRREVAGLNKKNARRGGGSPSRGGRVEGPGGCLRGKGFFFFCIGAEIPTNSEDPKLTN